MKILQIMAGGDVGGAEEFFVRLASAFETRRLDQTVVVRPNEKRNPVLRAAGIDPIELPFGGWLDFCTVPALAAEIAGKNPDIVLSWMSRASAATGKARRRARTRTVQVGRLGGYYDLKYYRSCDHLIGNTPDIVRYLVEKGWPEARAHYLPNFVAADPGTPLPRKQLDIPEGAQMLIAAGRLHRNKAFDVLIQAMTEADGVYLALAGDGPEAPAVDSLARELGVADRVRFLGWRTDIADLMATADMLVCPSRIEPLGNVLIEAWAHNLPVVAAASEGPSWLIADGETGLLAPVGDHRRLAAAISRIAEDQDLAARLARAGHERFETEFTETVVVEKFLTFFEKVTS